MLQAQPTPRSGPDTLVFQTPALAFAARVLARVASTPGRLRYIEYPPKMYWGQSLLQ